MSKTSGTLISNTSSPYTQTGLTNGSNYYFVVTAVNNVGEGIASNVVEASPFVPQKIIGGVVSDYLAKGYWGWGTYWKQLNPINTMHQNGFGWVRVPVKTVSSPDLANTSVSGWSSLPWKNEYWDSLEYANEILTQASNAGMRLNLVFYLSNIGAAAGLQNPPPEWQGLSVDATASALQNYCFQTTQYFLNKGLNIELYDIGNEIEFGILGFTPGNRVSVPSGIDITTNMDWTINNIWNTEATLLKAAIAGVKQANPNAKIVLHIAGVNSTSDNTFFKTMVSQGVDFDFAGLTYPYHLSGNGQTSGSPPYYTTSDFQSSVSFIASLGKKIIISEYDYPNSSTGITGAPDNGYPFTSAGQQKWVRDFIQYFMNNDNVAGFDYFYPEYFSGFSGGSTPGLDSSGLFISDSQIEPALTEFKF